MADVLHALEFRLAYSECDPAGIVYYATYYPWMERTNTEWLFVSGARPDLMTARWAPPPSPAPRRAPITAPPASSTRSAARCASSTSAPPR